jgi:hypothetical protein
LPKLKSIPVDQQPGHPLMAAICYWHEYTPVIVQSRSEVQIGLGLAYGYRLCVQNVTDELE